MKKALPFTPSARTDASLIAEMKILKKNQKITEEQQKFIDYYLEKAGDLPSNRDESLIVEGMKASGYTGNGYALEALGKLILNVFEANTPTADIFRAMDLGETKVIQRLKRIIEESVNTTAVIQAIKIVANALQMGESWQDESAGASIEIVTNHSKESEPISKHDHIVSKDKKVTLTILN
jgi:hypothetical protein